MWQISFFFFHRTPIFFFFKKKHLALYVEKLRYEFAAMFVSFVCIYFVSQICVNLTRDTFLVSPEKKRWQSLCILKPRCIIVPYFEWTWWYASIYLICVLCSFDSGLCQKDFVKLKQNLSRQYIFCVLRNSYRMARCHIRSQPDN